ncbi:unnamed protein product [Effrenium voratum]|nr:unnamed protein product [Effrenium voratum]
MSLLEVCLWSIGGRRLGAVQVSEDAPVKKLKYATADLLELPPKCHKLLCGGEIMASQKLLSQYSDGSSSLEVMVVISHELIYKRMFDPSDAVRQAALNTLSRAAETGSKAAIEAVSACLQDNSGEVRRIALKALSCISEEGNTQVIDLLCESLQRGDVFTKATAIKGLIKVAGIGHDQFVATMLELSVGATRRFAIESLPQVTLRGDPRSVKAASTALLDKDAQVRQAAVQSLGQLAPRGDQEVIAQLLRCLQEDSDKVVRRCAAIALGQVALQDDTKVLAVLQASAGDSSLRRVALSVRDAILSRAEAN